MNNRLPQQALSFRAKALLVSLALQTLFVAVFASSILYLLTARGTSALRDNLASATAGYARNAAFVFIGSLDANRTDFLTAASGSSNIEAAFLADAAYKVTALTDEKWRGVIERSTPATAIAGQSAAIEHAAFWVFYEPVFATNERECGAFDASNDQCAPSKELLGYFGVVGSKKLIFTLSRSVTIVVVASALVLLTLIYWATARLARKLYGPMLGLVTETLRAADQGYREKIDFTGPKEVEEVARAINHLIDRATQTAQQLEARVAEKTREERMAREQAETARAFAEKVKEWRTDLMAVNTHELLTPLRILIGELDCAIEELRFLDESRTKSAIARRLDLMRIPITRIEEIVEQVNIAMRIEEGRVEVRATRQSLDPMVERLKLLYAPEALRRRSRLGIVNDIRPPVETDHRMLETIASNLLSNACKFTRDGDIALCFSTDECDLVIACRDSGTGIAEDRRALIFEPLYQADMSSRRVADGLGLGLSIVKGYVDRLGGRIQLESVEGIGTTVTVRLPMADPYGRAS